jgi:hypothetical protein
MDIDGFRKFLSSRKLDQRVIKSSLNTLRDFELYLQKKSEEIETATRQDFYDYSDYMIESGMNTVDNYVSILRYGYFKKLNEIIIAGMEVLDGREVIENISNRLASEFSKEFRDSVFGDTEIPALGIRPDAKPQYMQKLITKLEKMISSDGSAEFLNQGLRDRYEESRKPDKEKFLKAKNIDEFLQQKHVDFVAELETHLKERTLFFTQEITREVVDHVRNDPSIESGVRKGDKIIIMKIPHMAKEYLAEKNVQRKRYYYCHCPWVKEAFKHSAKPLSPVFCNCSAGFYRAYWEIVFDEPIRVDVLESLLRGDSVCRFAVYIPASVIASIS